MKAKTPRNRLKRVDAAVKSLEGSGSEKATKQLVQILEEYRILLRALLAWSYM